jgi:hypothetical protein
VRVDGGKFSSHAKRHSPPICVAVKNGRRKVFRLAVLFLLLVVSGNFGLSARSFKTTHTTHTTLVTPQRGDNIDNFLLGRRPNGRWKEFGVDTVKVVKVVWVVWVVLKTFQYNVCVSSGMNNVRVSSGMNNVCVSSGLKAQQFHSPGQAKRRPGFGMRAVGAPCKGKSIRLLYTFALTGRSYICLPPTQGAAPLALG